MVSKVSGRALELAFKFKLGQVRTDCRSFYHSWLHQVLIISPKQYKEVLEETHPTPPKAAPVLSLQQEGAQLLHCWGLLFLGLRDSPARPSRCRQNKDMNLKEKGGDNLSLHRWCRKACLE